MIFHIVSYRMNFKKFSGEGLNQPLPRPLSALNLRLRRRFSGALRPQFGLRPQFDHPSNMFDNPSPSRGVLDCFPQTPTFWLHHRPNISFQDYVVGLIEIYQWKYPWRQAGKIFWKSRRDERVILEHTVLGIICTRSFHLSPECTKIVSSWGSAPDPAGGAYSAPPDPLAVMGWDGDLVTTCSGCELCAPLLVAGAPLLFWGWLWAWALLYKYWFKNDDRM